MKIILFGMTLIFLSACASTETNLQLESARSIGNVLPEDVSINNVDRGLTTVNWNANTKTGFYKCSADDMVRRVLCIKN